MNGSPPKLSELNEWFSQCPGALVAFSGGVDSSLVAWLARHFLGKEKVVAVISASSSLKLSELDGAKAFCLANDIPLKIIRTQELLNPNYFNNPSNRCYYCKSTLYEDVEGLRSAYPEYWILNGTNSDDLGDYRPGLEAARERKVRSPLVETHVDKITVRQLAQMLELTCWDKPASPCLSSRIPYGEQVTEEKLRRIENAEEWLSANGFRINRVRHVGDSARIEVPVDRVGDLPAIEQLRDTMRGFGFLDAEVDSEGFVTGKLNRVLS